MRTFDNLRITPRYPSTVDSRSMVDTSTTLTELKMDVPVIMPGMHSLYGMNMITNVFRAGGLVVHPRNGNDGTYYGYRDYAGIHNVSLEDSWRVSEELCTRGGTIALELNNGYLKKLHDQITKLKLSFPKVKIWAGAVCTAEGCKMLADAGADAVIVGNGVGSVCETTPRTAVGLPPVYTLAECMNSPIPVILAGGIKKYGDIIISLIMGAEAVMIGGLLASTSDNPNNGRYWGEASQTQKQTNHYIEGKEVTLPLDKITSYDRIREIKDAIQSACSFVGAFNLKELREKALIEELA